MAVKLLDWTRTRLVEMRAPAWIINRISAYVARNWKGR